MVRLWVVGETEFRSVNTHALLVKVESTGLMIVEKLHRDNAP